MERTATKQLAAKLTALKQYALLLLLVFSSSIMQAQWRSATEATELLLEHSRNGEENIPNKVRNKFKIAANEANLLYTAKMDGHNTIYVIGSGNNGGVVFVSGYEGNDILGYTDCGSFNIDSIPPALKQMMKQYSEQMIAAAKGWTGEQQKARLDVNRTARQPINHLIQTKWEQHDPYNKLCPNDYPTGCVATVFAQIMKYYNYPKHGKGSYSYSWNGQTLSADFGSTEYQWDKMLDNYHDGSYSEEKANAVATLMYHVGVATNMKYAKGGSSAYLDPEPIAKYFDYNAAYIKRDISGSDEDTRLMYEQLEKRHPIPFRGTGSGLGHAFIIDGYQDGLWGINWGWKGYCDGYFAIGALNPTEHESYNSDNRAILNLVPNGSYKADTEATDGEFTVTTPGTLRSLLGQTKYKKLTIHGNINGEDLRELRSRCLCEDYKYDTQAQGLVSLDLTDANLVGGGIYRLEASLSDPNNVKYYDCIAKKDTLSWGAFSYSNLEELLLPNSVKTLETQAIYQNEKLNRLRLPLEMEAYEESAVNINNAETKIEVGNGAKPVIEDNALYLKDYQKLCLVLGEHNKFTVNQYCKEIDGGAFNNVGCKVGTLVVPQIEGELSLGYQDIDKLWVAGNIDLGFRVQKAYTDIHIDLYLPSAQMVSIQNTNNNDNYIRNIYVPAKVMSQYLADKNWATYSNCFKAIDDVNMCMKDSHLEIQPEKGLKLYEQTRLLPLIYDSNLTKAQATWSSSDNDIATVDSEGNVTARNQGSADITVSINGYKATCRITVAGWPTVYVEQPGTLANLLKGKEYEYLAVTGNINGEDFKELNSRFSCHYQDKYTSEGKRTISGLNLSDANIVDGGVYNEEYNYVCKANTLSRLMFSSGSTIKVLILPKSVTTMKSYCITTCDNLQVLKLPECLTKYENNAIDLYHQNYDINIDVPESSCVTMKDGMLYEKDFSRLHLCLIKKTTVVIDSRCEDIDSYAFYAYNYDFGTIIAPYVTSYYVSGGFKVKNVWLGNANSISPYSINDSEMTVFLPAKRMTILDSTNDEKSCGKILVPKDLISTYKSDANWSKHAKSIEAIEDCGIVLDECGILLPENMDIMVNSFESISPQMLDTRLMNQSATMTSSDPWTVSVKDNGEMMSFYPGEADVTVRAGDVSKTCHIKVHEWPTVHVEQQGTLADIIGDNTYKYLRVTGNINGDDIYKLRYLCNANDVGSDGYFTNTNSNAVLEYLDIKDAKLKKGGVYASFWDREYSLENDNALAYNIFSASNLKMLRLPAAASETSMYTRVMQYNYRLQYVELPEDLKGFSKYTISGSSELKGIIYRGKQFLKPDTQEEFTEFKDVTLYVRKSLLDTFRNNSIYTAAFKSIEPLEDKILDGIGSVKIGCKTTDNIIYNIMGQKISTLQKGINIINGKKVLIEE